MHAKSSKETKHESWYLQWSPLQLLDQTFPYLIFASSYLLCLSCSNAKVLQENSKCLRGRERERIERKLQNWTDQKPWTDPQIFLLLMRPLFSSFSISFLHFPPHMQPMTFHLLFLLISIIFLHFPPHMQPVTFQLYFLLISIIFINKCAKIPHASPNLSHCFCQFP